MQGAEVLRGEVTAGAAPDVGVDLLGMQRVHLAIAVTPGQKARSSTTTLQRAHDGGKVRVGEL